MEKSTKVFFYLVGASAKMSADQSIILKNGLCQTFGFAPIDALPHMPATALRLAWPRTPDGMRTGVRWKNDYIYSRL